VAIVLFVGRDAGLGVGDIFTTEAHDEMGDGLAEESVFNGLRSLSSASGDALLLQLAGLGDEAVALAW